VSTYFSTTKTFRLSQACETYPLPPGPEPHHTSWIHAIPTSPIIAGLPIHPSSPIGSGGATQRLISNDGLTLIPLDAEAAALVRPAPLTYHRPPPHLSSTVRRCSAWSTPSTAAGARLGFSRRIDDGSLPPAPVVPQP
jgi:hypothetical protein